MEVLLSMEESTLSMHLKEWHRIYITDDIKVFTDFSGKVITLMKQ